MLPRVLASLLCLVGAAAIGLGTASATLWRADDTLMATATSDTLVATDPGVLDLAAQHVTVRAVAQGSDVVLTLGRTSDVEAWLGTDAQTWVTGLTDLRTLSTRAVEAREPSPAPTEAPATETPAAETPAAETPATAEPGSDEIASGTADPTGSDLWVEEADGRGEATLEWDREDGRWSVLAAAVGADAGPVTLELTWPQVVTTPWLIPGVAVGSVLLVVGLLWWVVLLWGTRWLGPIGVVAAGWSAQLLAVLRHDDSESQGDRRPATHPVAVVDRTARVEPRVAPVTIPPIRPAAEPVLGASTAGTPAVPGPPVVPVVARQVPDGAPLTRRQLREREAAAAGQHPTTWTASEAPAEPRGARRSPHAAVVPEPPLVHPVVDPRRTGRRAERPVAAPPAVEPPAVEPPAVRSPAVESPAVESPAVQSPAAESPSAASPTVAPTPAPRRRLGRIGRSGRGAVPVPAAPAVVPEPEPEPEQVAVTPAASADAWRKAWGFPSIDRPGGPETNPIPEPSVPASDAEEQR